MGHFQTSMWLTHSLSIFLLTKIYIPSWLPLTQTLQPSWAELHNPYIAAMFSVGHPLGLAATAFPAWWFSFFLLPSSFSHHPLPRNPRNPSSASLPSHWPSVTLFTNQNQLGAGTLSFFHANSSMQCPRRKLEEKLRILWAGVTESSFYLVGAGTQTRALCKSTMFS